MAALTLTKRRALTLCHESSTQKCVCNVFIDTQEFHWYSRAIKCCYNFHKVSDVGLQ